MSIRQSRREHLQIGTVVAIRGVIMNQFTLDIEKQLANLGKEIREIVDKVVPSDERSDSFDPPCDLIDRAESLTIVMDLPGMVKEMIKITLKNRVLSIAGERELYLEDGEALMKSERKEGAFSRSFALPEEAVLKNIDAAFKDGVLSVTVQKSTGGKTGRPETIPVR
ncbi:MAG: Hsp20/alpha crystallin family protein [Balneolaceae bacterium]|nr:MAG: Hsp20/alpha crystallin family protein [Balneolaceae bacterium]